MEHDFFSDITAVVPASGFSRRMGCNKLLLDYHGETIVEHVIKVLLHFEWSKIIVVTADPEVDAVIRRYDIHLIHNDSAYMGQSQSVIKAVETSPKSRGWFFISADMPLMDQRIIYDVRRHIDIHRDSIVVSRYCGKNGQPVYFPAAFREDLLSITGDNGGRQVIREYPSRVSYIDFYEADPGLDMDTPEIYYKIRSRT